MVYLTISFIGARGYASRLILVRQSLLVYSSYIKADQVRYVSFAFLDISLLVKCV
jgi:hypothetical protein